MLGNQQTGSTTATLQFSSLPNRSRTLIQKHKFLASQSSAVLHTKIYTQGLQHTIVIKEKKNLFEWFYKINHDTF